MNSKGWRWGLAGLVAGFGIGAAVIQWSGCSIAAKRKAEANQPQLDRAAEEKAEAARAAARKAARERLAVQWAWAEAVSYRDNAFAHQYIISDLTRDFRGIPVQDCPEDFQAAWATFRQAFGDYAKATGYSLVDILPFLTLGKSTAVQALAAGAGVGLQKAARENEARNALRGPVEELNRVATKYGASPPLSF